MTLQNFDLKEQVRAYWTARADVFDASPGHRIRSEPEFSAYESLIRRHAPGLVGGEVLDAASGTGEVTRLLRRLGCRVTGMDLSDRMVKIARAKHGEDPGVKFIEGDAERLTLPDETFDGVICRNLVWTLTDPDAAFREWFRVLKPGGTLVAFEGNWMQTTRVALILRALSARLGREVQVDAPDFTSILAQLPFRHSLTPADLTPKLRPAGFPVPSFHPIGAVTRAQLARATWAERLSLLSFSRGRFMLVAGRPATEKVEAASLSDELIVS